MDPTAPVKQAARFAKAHVLAAILFAFVAAVLALAYNARNGGALAARFASWPLVGRLFRS